MAHLRLSPAPTRPVWVEHVTREASSSACPLVVHDHAALVFLTEGAALHQQRGNFEVAAGDVLLVPAGEAHRLLRATRTAAWGVGFRASCYAPSELVELLDPFERTRAGSSPVVSIPTERHEPMARLMAELRAETTADRPHGELVQKSLLALVLAQIARAASFVPQKALRSSVVADALRFIERRCLEPISLSDVAGAVGRSPSYVTTALKQATGKSAVAWIIDGRLSEARNRLLHSDERVEIIAERVGYADATHFIRLFRRAHGVTPAAWRDARRRR